MYGWIDATHLVGHASLPSGGWTDAGGWVWEPGTAPKLVNLAEYPGQPYLGYGWPYVGTDLMVPTRIGGCAGRRSLLEASAEEPNRTPFEVPVLCDVVGVVGSEILLGHWNPDRSAGDSNDPNYANGTVVALDIHDADRPYLDPALGGPTPTMRSKTPPCAPWS